MTVSTLTNRVVYRGNGSTTQFPVPFKVNNEDHLVVIRQVFATGALDYTYVGTDFSYTGIGADSGTLTLSGTALSSTYELVIERIVPYTQELDLVNSGGFYPETVEEQLDLIVMGLQQVAADAETAMSVVDDAEAAAQAVLDAAVFTVTSATGQSVTTRTLLAGISSPANGQMAYLAEAGRSGWFKFSTADLSTEVTADSLQGIYVAPSAAPTGASGAWVRDFKGPVYPSWWGAVGGNALIDTQAHQACFTYATSTGAEIALETNKSCLIASELVADGINVSGNSTSELKVPDQIITTLTAGVTSGTGSKTLSVADTTGFFVGQSVMLATSPATTSHSDPYSHANRVISAISTPSGPGTITIAAGPAIQAHSSGAILATTTHILRALGNSKFSGFKVNANEANQTNAHWQNSIPLTAEGDNVTFDGLIVEDTASDAVLFGGPNGGRIVGGKVLNCHFNNIGGNAVHLGNAEEAEIDGCRFVDCNMRFDDLVIEGGGDLNDDGVGDRSGHQDAAISISDKVRHLKVSNSYFENCHGGIGAIATSGTNFNERIESLNNTFVNVANIFEISNESQLIKSVGDTVDATFPYPRWSTCQISIAGTSAAAFVKKVHIEGFTMKNGSISVGYAKELYLDVNIDDREMINEFAGGVVKLVSFAEAEGRVSVRGGQVGLFMQDFNEGLKGDCSELKVNLRDQKVRAMSGDAGAGSLNVVLTGRARGTSGISDATWIGMTHLAGVKMLGVAVDHNLGGSATAFDGGVAGTDRVNCIINGTFE